MNCICFAYRVSVRNWQQRFAVAVKESVRRRMGFWHKLFSEARKTHQFFGASAYDCSISLGGPAPIFIYPLRGWALCRTQHKLYQACNADNSRLSLRAQSKTSQSVQSQYKNQTTSMHWPCQAAAFPLPTGQNVPCFDCGEAWCL